MSQRNSGPCRMNSELEYSKLGYLNLGRRCRRRNVSARWTLSVADNTVIDAWAAPGALREDYVLEIVASREKTNLSLFEQIAVVAAAVSREPSVAHAKARFNRSPTWLSKHVTLRRCTPTHLPITYGILRDDLCSNLDIVYSICQLEKRSHELAAQLRERLIHDKRVRQSGRRFRKTDVLGRDEINALVRALKNRPRKKSGSAGSASPASVPATQPLPPKPAARRSRQAPQSPEPHAIAIQISLC